MVEEKCGKLKKTIRREYSEVKKAVSDKMAAVVQAVNNKFENIVCDEPRFEVGSCPFSMSLVNGATPA